MKIYHHLLMSRGGLQVSSLYLLKHGGQSPKPRVGTVVPAVVVFSPQPCARSHGFKGGWGC